MAEIIDVSNIKAEKKTPEKQNKPPSRRPNRLIKLPPAPARMQFIPQIPQNHQVSNLPVDNEIKTGLKSSILGVLSSTFPDKQKRIVMKDRLEKSNCVNKYIDTRMNDTFLNQLNDHLKFAVVYAYNWFDIYAGYGNTPQPTPNPNPNPNPI